MKDTSSLIVSLAHDPAQALGPVLAHIGSAANQAAQESELQRYQSRKTTNTLRRQRADIALFAQFLLTAGVLVEHMSQSLAAWSGVTYGLVEAFNLWQLEQGYAIGSINVRLATIKAYCGLASRAGYIPAQEYALIRTVKGYRASEGRNVNEKRAAAGTRTRKEHAKKADPTSISPAHAALLKRLGSGVKAKRDALIMCLLLEHGLRVSEVSDLDVKSFDLASGTMTFYRVKVGLVQTHNLTPDTLQAAQAYLATLPAEQEPLFVGPCSKQRLSERTINARVATLGYKTGIASLSPHDGRHFWATDAIRNDTDIKSLQDAGGWASPAMPLRYAESAKVANAGVKLTSHKK